VTSRDFCFWLQGFLEIQEAAVQPTMTTSNAFHALDPMQLQCVKRHLALVFTHEIDPSMGPAQHQASLDKIHAPTTTLPHGGGGLIRC
jgi:hypothetical protein